MVLKNNYHIVKKVDRNAILKKSKYSFRKIEILTKYRMMRLLPVLQNDMFNNNKKLMSNQIFFLTNPVSYKMSISDHKIM